MHAAHEILGEDEIAATPEIRIVHLTAQEKQRETVAEALRNCDFNYRLKTVGDRSALMAILNTETPDLILSNLAFPDFNGIEALEWTRRHHSSLPFVLIVDNPDPKISAEAIEYGISAILQEDMMHELAELIRELVHGGNTRIHEGTLSLNLEETFASALSNTRDMVVITDPGGRILFVNRAFEQQTGFTLKEVEGENPRILNSGSQHSDFYKILWSTILSGRVWSGEFINRKKDASLYPEESTITPVRNAAGHMVAFVAVKRDLSEKRRLEEDLRLSNKMEALGRMAGGIAHNFNNLMTAAMASTDIVLFRDRLSLEDRLEFDNIRDVLAKASALTKHLLSMSAHQYFRWERIEFHQFIETQLEVFRQLLPENIDLSFSDDAGGAEIQGDREHLSQALVNIILNARDAMPDGGRIHIRCRSLYLDGDQKDMERQTPGNYIALDIEDEGQGMEPKRLMRALDPFFTTNDSRGRIGLGLNIVHGIVQQHQGSLEIQSSIDHGTRITICIPRAEPIGDSSEDEEDFKISGRNQPRSEKLSAIKRKAKNLGPILIVEDEAPLRLAMLKILKSLDFKGVAVADAQSALEMIEEGLRPQLVISDVQLPGMKGTELLRELRSRSFDVPFLFCSGFSQEDLARDAHKFENSAFLSKPFHAEELASAIREILGA